MKAPTLENLITNIDLWELCGFRVWEIILPMMWTDIIRDPLDGRTAIWCCGRRLHYSEVSDVHIVVSRGNKDARVILRAESDKDEAYKAFAR